MSSLDRNARRRATHEARENPTPLQPPDVARAARTYRFRALDPRVRGGAEGFPDDLTLVFPDAKGAEPAQLIVGRLPLQSRLWRWDASRGILSWQYRVRGHRYGGRLTFTQDGRKCVGTLMVDTRSFAVAGELPPITYTCSVAMNTGAYATGVAPSLSLVWDATSTQWQNATWIPNALDFTYQVLGVYIVGQMYYDVVVTYTDDQTNNSWSPMEGTIGWVMDENFAFTVTANQGVDPTADDRSKLSDPSAGAISTIFPYTIRVQLSATAQQIAGAMLTVNDDMTGVVLGVQGVATNPSVVGLYRMRGGQRPAAFSVYGAKLWVDDQPVGSSRLIGNRLTWSHLPVSLQSASGLGEEGTLEFTDDGASLAVAGTALAGQRVSADELGATLSASDLQACGLVAEAREAPALGLADLDDMSQFELVTDPVTGNPVWVDVVQQAMMNDFNQVVLYYMPSDLRQTFYGQAQVNLSPQLQQIAAMAPAGQDPGAWYQSLAVAFLTNVLSTWNEDGAAQLNALRAQAWLKSQAAISPVFQTQSTAMYAMEWPNVPQNANLGAYRADQVDNQTQYDALIAADQAAWLRDLQQTIVDADALSQMQGIVNNLATAAIENALYWAYTYFRQATLPASMSVLQMLALGQTADTDGSAWLRETQRTFAILSLLDPSNMFANQYIYAVNTMLYANLVPAVVDPSSQSVDYADGVKAVLQQTVLQCAGSSDPVVQEIGADAATLAGRSDLASLVAKMQAAAASAVSPGWGAIAQPMADAVIPLVGEHTAGVLCLAVQSVATTTMLYGTTDWSGVIAAAADFPGASVPPDVKKAITAAQYLIQVAGFVLKWGVALDAAFNTYATTWDAVSSLFSTQLLSRANQSIQNGFAKWLIDNGETPVDSEIFGNLFTEEAQGSEKVLIAVFGKNLDDFVATRLGAVFAGVNLIISAINLASATGDLDIAANALNVAAGALNLVATAGSWALSAAGVTEIGGLEVATICSVLSALAIVAAIAGIVMLLVMFFEKHPTPVQQFGTNQATDAGLYMPYSSAIDYFNGYIDSGGLLRLGVSLFNPINPINSGALRVNADGSVGSASEDYSYDTVFFCNTDAFGRTQFSTLINSGGTPTPVVLTGNADNSVSFQPAGAAGSDVAARQLWIATLQAGPTMDGSHPQSGAFTIQLNGTSNYLNWSNGSATLAGVGVSALWAITQEPMAPAGLSMANIALYTFSQGQVFTPVLQQPGSLPKTWSISPALPAFLAFDTGTGKISQVAGQKPPITPAATFTLSVQNTVSAAPATTTFTISVAQHT